MAIASCIVYIVVTGCIFIHIGWMGDCWTLMGIFVDSANSDRQFFFKLLSQNNKDIPLQIKHATDGSQRVIPNCRQRPNTHRCHSCSFLDTLAYTHIL